MDRVVQRKINWRKIERVISAILLVIFGLVLFVLIIFQTPPVQNLIRKKVVSFLEKKLETKVAIGDMQVGFNKLVLQDLYVEDREQDTLLAGGNALFRLNLLDLLLSNDLNIESIHLEDFHANVKRTLPDTLFNFQFVIDAFTPKTAGDPDTGTVQYAIPVVTLRDIRFNFEDVLTGVNAKGTLGVFNSRIDALDGRNLYFDVPVTEIEDFHAVVRQYKPLVSADPASEDSEAINPALDIRLGILRLKNIDIDFDNDVSTFYSDIRIGEMAAEARQIDIPNRNVELELIALSNSSTTIRLGQSEGAAEVEREVKEEVAEASMGGWKVIVDELDLRNNRFVFDNDNQPASRRGIDYAHFDARDFSLRVEDFKLSRDSIGGLVRHAAFREKSGFVLEELKGDVLYANTTLSLDDLFLKTPGTELKRYARMDFASWDAFANRFAETRMRFDLDNSYVKVSDILAFAPMLASQPAFSNPNDTWFINLQGEGSLSSFHIEDLQFSGFRDTRIDIDGTLAFGNSGSQAGGTLRIRRLHTTRSDITLFTGSRLSNANFRFPETIDVTGTARGGSNGIIADLDIASSAGNMSVDGEIRNLSNPANASYNTQVVTGGLDLGSLMPNEQLGRISANLRVVGQGLTAGNFDTDFRGHVSSLGYGDYVYRNADIEGQLAGNTLRATLNMQDPNADLNGTLMANLGNTTSFTFNGFVDSLKLQPLGFSKNPVVFRGRIDADVPVLTEEMLEADVLITEALVVSASQRLPLDTVRFTANRDDSLQYMRLRSDVANANLTGRFRVGELGAMFNDALRPYFTIDDSSPGITAPYSMTFDAQVTNAPILADFIPGLDAFDPLSIQGSLNSETGLNAVAKTNLLDYNGNLFQGLDLNIQTTAQGLAFNGEVQRLKSNAFDIHRTTVSGVANNNQVDFRLAMEDDRARRRYFLSGLLTQPSGGIMELNLRPDSLMINYQFWAVSPGNSIRFGNGQLTADNFVLSRGPEQLSLQSRGNLLDVGFTNFQLSNITAFLKSDTLAANGRMTGTASFRNILRQPVFTSDLNIADLSIRGDTLGNAAIKVDNLTGNTYRTNATITGRGNDISLTGSFAPSFENDIALNLDLAIRQLQLSTVDGALGGFLENSSGAVRGNIRIDGSLAKPRINGPIAFDNASFALTVLGSQFRIDGEELVVTENGFRFDDFVIRDSSNQVMTLNGRVTTTDFAKYAFDLDVRADNFQLLNTTKRKNDIYYGEMVVTTDLHVGGNTDRPVVDGSVVINDGTNLTLVIPQRSPGVVSRAGIVEFVNLDNPALDTLFRAYDSLNVSPFKGMDITSNIEIRREAVFNVVVDEANGDFLNIQGEALITTGIDPSGKITMVGNYELERGAYEITFNFLKRRFDIEKGSRIQWFNEPTRATLDIRAVYIANTSPIELVQQQVEAATPAIRNTYLQKLPFEVRMHLTGELLQPAVAFDIVLPPDRTYGVSNDIITQVESRLSQVRSDPGETNKQVFALLLLNRFVGENPLESSQDMISASTYARQSVSRLLTEQLNQLAAGLINGVDLRFDVVTTEDYTTGSRRSRTDLNVGLSKQLLNERLTVTVGTNLELEGSKPVNPGASANNNALGNISVEYALSRDRRYMLRFYRKNEYQGILDGYVIESGLSFLLSVDYEKVRELLRKRRNQKVEGVE